MEDSAKKVLIFGLSSFGHLNPIACLVSELINRNYKVINYGEERCLVKIAHDYVPFMLNEINIENPDLIIYDQYLLSVKYLQKILKKKSNTNKDLQPKKELFDASFNFVGCCLSTEARATELKDEKINILLNNFETINPNFGFIKPRIKLIYVSLGTIFYYDLSVFQRIIEGFSQLEKENFKMVIACGRVNLEKLNEMVSKGDYVIPDNILLSEFAPQIEILKRASLFITHAGMNSTSETIHFGVPVNCIPVKCDQPLCAFRFIDDLKLGVRLDPLEFTVNDIKDSMEKVLNDQTYLDRILKMTKISRQYDGVKNGANIIEKLLDKNKF
ncbi:unnamed protein product [Brachionus calyciflorus]|uniref:UDP-glucuronosyltransferase n=1 Tax=Brachionus calyciflorus TaxID=104777 RepID=A0A813WX29_9BILA|nr:unnamed protein product [Brachionus calyciflorus]